jgi:hypothetical protein
MVPPFGRGYKDGHGFVFSRRRIGSVRYQVVERDKSFTILGGCIVIQQPVFRKTLIFL